MLTFARNENETVRDRQTIQLGDDTTGLVVLCRCSQPGCQASRVYRYTTDMAQHLGTDADMSVYRNWYAGDIHPEATYALWDELTGVEPGTHALVARAAKALKEVEMFVGTTSGLNEAAAALVKALQNWKTGLPEIHSELPDQAQAALEAAEAIRHQIIAFVMTMETIAETLRALAPDDDDDKILAMLARR